MNAKGFNVNEFIDKMTDKKPQKAEPTEGAPESAPGGAPKPDYAGFKSSELLRVSFRFKARDVEVLRRYFESRDITLSQGIRIALKDFMERQGI